MSHVVVETQDRITRIEFNRPEKKNALSPEMYVAMAQA
jgi:enoyl-CoA hydratase/carnithine racemase